MRAAIFQVAQLNQTAAERLSCIHDFFAQILTGFGARRARLIVATGHRKLISIGDGILREPLQS
jgi:hypothetical protein